MWWKTFDGRSFGLCDKTSGAEAELRNRRPRWVGSCVKGGNFRATKRALTCGVDRGAVLRKGSDEF